MEKLAYKVLIYKLKQNSAYKCITFCHFCYQEVGRKGQKGEQVSQFGFSVKNLKTPLYRKDTRRKSTVKKLLTAILKPFFSVDA